MRPLVLASTSPYRASLLTRLGLAFETAAPKYVESNDPGAEPAELVEAQAAGKARSLVPDYPGHLIIGCDQVAELDGEILSKPGGFEGAVAQLERLQGREHRLLTALVVVVGNREERHLEISPIGIRALERAEIEAYVRRERPYDCAGSYKAESLGPTIFDYERGDDPTAVVGLPLIGLCRVLRRLGCDPLGAGGH